MRNKVRVKWPGGVFQLANGSGEARFYRIDAGNAETYEQAYEIGLAALADFAYSPRETITAKVNDTPEWPETGDAISTFDGEGDVATNRMLTRRIEATDTGLARLVPTLSSPSEQFALRQARTIRDLNNSNLGGRRQGGNPFLQIQSGVLSGTLSAPSVPPFSFSPVDVIAAPAWEVTDYVVLTKTIIQLRENFTAGGADAPAAATLSGDMTFKLFIDDTLGTFFSVTAGTSDYSVIGSIPLTPGQLLAVSIDAIGPEPTYEELDEVNATVQFETAPGSLDRNDKVN